MKQTTRNRHYNTVEKALDFILQQQQQQPDLATIAKHCSLSEFHFQRIFSQWAGISPKQFLQLLTKEQAKTRLLSGDSLQRVSEHSGLSSSSRLHDLFITLEAVTPGELKTAGAGLSIDYGSHSSPFGHCFIACTSRGIHRLEFVEENNIKDCVTELQREWPQATIKKNQLSTQVLIEGLFSNHRNHQPIKLWIKGSHFQFKVWEALLSIPYGSLSTYSSIAASIEQPAAARAVGSAVAKNPIALLIPCHRVIQASGALGGYRWGLARKQALIGDEASAIIN
ncbi:MAG: bifunctional helix-turn-helix domain-containing protein/methylated-DNA--[protein]-cysteine S-methyltransferase [Spongiibacteraceae bacterium]